MQQEFFSVKKDFEGGVLVVPRGGREHHQPHWGRLVGPTVTLVRVLWGTRGLPPVTKRKEGSMYVGMGGVCAKASRNEVDQGG